MRRRVQGLANVAQLQCAVWARRGRKLGPRASAFVGLGPGFGSLAWKKKRSKLNKLADWKEMKGMRMQILLTGEYRSVESRCGDG